MRFALLAVSLTWSAAAAAAPTPTAEPAPAPAGLTPAPADDYRGVAPEKGGPPPGTPAPAGGGPVVTWLGFQALPGAIARVFVQLNRPVVPEIAEARGGWVVRLPGCRIAAPNHGRRMDTRFFDTPLREFAAHQAGEDVLVTVRRKGPAQIAQRAQAAASGFHFLFLELTPARPAAPAKP